MAGVLGAAEEELQRVKRQLKESEELAQQAAQAGLGLLSQQVELQTRLEEQRVEMTNAMEVLEQEKYSLQREVELKTQMLASLRCEYDGTSSQHTQQLLKQEERLVRAHTMEVNTMKYQIIQLQSDLEESRLNEKQLKHKVDVQTEHLNHNMEELRVLHEQKQNTVSSEVMEMQVMSLELENTKARLQTSLQEAQYKDQQFELSKSSLQRQLKRITEDKEEREKEAVSWFNALEKSREEIKDLQAQMDQVVQQAQDPNSKGNSLFAELEDRRSEMEKQLISMKVQHQSLQKQHAFSKQHLHRMKVQIATLMQLQGTRADPAQLERLQSMLSEKNQEIHNLVFKVQKLEKLELLLKSQPSVPAPSDGRATQDETYYTDLLQLKLSNSLKDAERLGDELSLQRMKSLAESQRALELERKLFSLEQLLKQAQSDRIKLQLRLEELRQKYEPNDLNKTNTQRRKREKLPDDRLPCEVVDIKPNEASDKALAHKTIKYPIAENQHKAAPLPTQDQEPDAPPRKSVKICEKPPSEVPNHPSSHLMDSTESMKQEEQFSRGGGTELSREEVRRKKSMVQVIHVKAETTMEDQCAQQ